MDATGISTSLKSGAIAVQMGTVFLTCEESGINSSYKEQILATKVDNTTLTAAFSGKFARGIQNTFIDRMAKHQDCILDYPIQNTFNPLYAKGRRATKEYFVYVHVGRTVSLFM